MDLLLPLISFLLVAGGGGRQHVSFADAATAAAAATNSESTPAAYWQAVLPGVPMPPAIRDLLISQNEHASLGDKNIRGLASSQIAGSSDSLNFVKTLRKIGPDYGRVSSEADPEGLKKITLSYGSEVEDLKKGTIENISELSKYLHKLSPRPQVEENLQEISVAYGSKGNDDVKEISMSYGEYVKEALKEISMSYGAHGEEGVKDIPESYGAHGEEDIKEVLMSYGAEEQNDLKEISVSYGAHDEKDIKEISVSHGAEGQEDRLKEISVSYGFRHEVNLKKDSIGHESHNEGEGHHDHVHANSHNLQRLADVFFFHDALRPGSRMTPTIPPTTSLPALLPRDVADAIPFSVDRLPDILAMFAPASSSAATAKEIRWTLDTCEHRRRTSLVLGERAGCATSLESLVDLAASLLRTRDVGAFSAGGLPVQAPGTPARRGMHTVTAVRRLAAGAGSEEDAVTCHDLMYPYAVFYCHTSSPTAAYAVTLQASDEAAPATTEVLAVCHLDTSRWRPDHPFFVAQGVRPGDVAVCHFLSKLSIVWVRTGGAGDYQGDASQ